MQVLYSGKFSRTINFTVFMDFIATSKINARNLLVVCEYNDSLAYPQMFICKICHWVATSIILKLKNYLHMICLLPDVFMNLR